MEYQSAAAAAERLGVTVRAVQKWAKSGKLAGAFKAGRDWMIPIEAARDAELTQFGSLFPLFELYCPAGKLREGVREMEPGASRTVAEWELLYARGKISECARLTEGHLEDEDYLVCLSANVYHTFSCLGCLRLQSAVAAAERLQEKLESVTLVREGDVAATHVYLSAHLVNLQLNLKEDNAPYVEGYLRALTSAERAIACFLLALSAYQKHDFSRSLGIAQTALTLIREDYLLPKIYLYIMAAIDLINLREIERATYYIEQAWQLAEPDGLIMPFAENYVLLLGLLEHTLKRAHPKGYKAIISATKEYQTGWFGLYNRVNSTKIAEDLTPIELTIAMLYHRNWRAKEIAAHLRLAERTVVNHIQTIYEKIGARGRRALGAFMLR